MLKSKLIQTLEFTPPALREVTLRIVKMQGINLGQGVCLLPVPEVVLKGAEAALRRGDNRYCPAAGIAELRDAIAGKLNAFNSLPVKSENVVVTNGATGAFEAVCEAFLAPGDEVISFLPYYPYHHNALKRRHITVRYVPLRPPGWNFDLKDIECAVSPRTKFILVNTPNNPTGKVFSQSELEELAQVCVKQNIFAVTDEVYEYMTYGGRAHISMGSLPGMAERCITIGSYSKTFAVTGWRIGYLAAPLCVVDELRTLVDQFYVCAPTPLQYGVALGIRELDHGYYASLHSEYSRKKELMKQALLRGGLEPNDPQGAYYMLADLGPRFPGKDLRQLLDILIDKAQVGAVPASDFVASTSEADFGKFFRFCFAVPDEMLVRAGERLAQI